MAIELIITIIVSVSIFLFKSYHDYLHRKKINNNLHNKIDGLMSIVNVMQDNLLPKKESDLINEALTLESKLLNNDEKDEKDNKEEINKI